MRSNSFQLSPRPGALCAGEVAARFVLANLALGRLLGLLARASGWPSLLHTGRPGPLDAPRVLPPLTAAAAALALLTAGAAARWTRGLSNCFPGNIPRGSEVLTNSWAACP